MIIRTNTLYYTYKYHIITILNLHIHKVIKVLVIILYWRVDTINVKNPNSVNTRRYKLYSHENKVPTTSSLTLT